MIRITLIIILFSYSWATTRNNSDKKTIIWETELYSISTNNDSLLAVIKSDINRYKGYPKSVKEKYKAGFYRINENIFQSCPNEEKYLLEKWTGDLYRKKLLNVINKKSNEIEKNIIEKEYDDVGTSGKKIYVGETYLFTIIERIY